MSQVIELLRALDESVLFEQKDSFKKSELTPVMFGKPGAPGQGSNLPQPEGEAPKSVEVINVEEPKDKDGKDSDDKSGQQDSDKGQKGKPSSKPGGKPTSGKDAPGPGEKKEVKLDKSNTEKEGEGKEGEGKSGKRPTRDAHAILDTSDAAEMKDMAEKILEKAEAIRKERNTGDKEPGSESGSYMDKLRDLHKPKIDWANELRKRVTEFKSRTAATISRMSLRKAERYKEGEGIQKSKSYLTYLRDPRSHTPGSKILFKGPYVKAPVAEIVLIVALDTSGSIGESTIGKVFAEMDKIAAAFKRGFSAGTVKLEGRVYFITWDTAIHNAEEYKAGGWKAYKEGSKGIGGRGGTDLTSVFEYFKSHTLHDPDRGSAAMLNIVKKPVAMGMSKDDIVIPLKGKGSEASAIIAPFLIIATDGQFGKVSEKDLGMLFKDNHKNILYLIIDGTSEYCYPKSKENIINYETYRV
jgi:hypothetical protein